MIDKICVFLLFCFALTSNIKTADSARNRITPIRFVIEVCNEQYGRTLKKLKTFNKHSIHITSRDLKILSTGACETLKFYQLKLKSRNKLEQKAQDIKCSFCVIAKSNIADMQDLVEKLITEIPLVRDEVATVERLEEEAKIILYFLMFSDLETGKWLWNYFLKIVAIGQYEYNGNFFRENPFEDQQLQTGLSDFIEDCVAQNYLPAATTESDLIGKNPSVYNDMFTRLRDSDLVTDVLHGGVFVTTDFLYLKPFWHDDELLFRQITEVDVDWSWAKRRHRAEVAITREFVENRTWINDPYGRLDHQHLLVKILDARLYCYISFVLHIYEKQLTVFDDEETLERIKEDIYNFIQGILSLTAFKDEFLVLSISELQLVNIREVNDDVKDILARVTAKTIEILNDLNGVNTNEIDYLSFDVSEVQLSDNDWITRIVERFNGYLTELEHFMPFEYSVLLHFMDVVKLSTAQYV